MSNYIDPSVFSISCHSERQITQLRYVLRMPHPNPQFFTITLLVDRSVLIITPSALYKTSFRFYIRTTVLVAAVMDLLSLLVFCLTMTLSVNVDLF